MSSASFQPFCLGLNVLTRVASCASYDNMDDSTCPCGVLLQAISSVYIVIIELPIF